MTSDKSPSISKTAFHEREAVAEFLQTLADEPHPCQGCAHITDCETGKACLDFAVFLKTGTLQETRRFPTTAQYQILFPE